MKISWIIAGLAAVQAGKGGKRKKQKVEKTPAWRIENAKELFAEWEDANCGDEVRPGRCKKISASYLRRWAMIETRYAKCGFYDNTIKHGGPPRKERRRRSEEEYYVDYNDYFASEYDFINDGLDDDEKAGSTDCPCEGEPDCDCKSERFKISKNPERALKQFNNLQRQFIRRYLSNCKAEENQAMTKRSRKYGKRITATFNDVSGIRSARSARHAARDLRKEAQEQERAEREALRNSGY
jgi:hypothetical protein